MNDVLEKQSLKFYLYLRSGDDQNGQIYAMMYISVGLPEQNQHSGVNIELIPSYNQMWYAKHFLWPLVTSDD